MTHLPLDTDLAHRLQRLEDLEAIAQLRANYCHLLDDRQWDAFVDLFIPEGEFHGLRSVRGHAELHPFFSQDVPRLQDAFWHFCSNGTATVTGDIAQGRISMEFLSVTDGVSYVSAGHYDDVMHRVQGQWKFASRRITFYYYNRLADGFTGYHPPLR